MVLSFIVIVLSLSLLLLIYLFYIQTTVSSSSSPPNPSAYLLLFPPPSVPPPFVLELSESQVLALMKVLLPFVPRRGQPMSYDQKKKYCMQTLFVKK